jgi:hypothetical protein
MFRPKRTLAVGGIAALLALFAAAPHLAPRTPARQQLPCYLQQPPNCPSRIPVPIPSPRPYSPSPTP